MPPSTRRRCAKLKSGDVTLIDIREPDEFAREHIAGARSVPLSTMEGGHFAVAPQGTVVFVASPACAPTPTARGSPRSEDGEAFMLDGGLGSLEECRAAGDDGCEGAAELNRQVQITIGLLMLTGVALTLFVDRLFLALPAFLGAGLLFAGVSGWCGMAHLIALAPWNRRPQA